MKETIEDLEMRWYKSIEFGDPDFGVYDSDAYIEEAEKCWKLYSRRYVFAIGSVIPRSPASILDLGCGIGKTTEALAEQFPGATVYCTNWKPSRQYKICQEKGLEIFPTIDKVPGHVELVFASEYFEHIYRPIEHLLEVVAKLRPRYFVIANSFNTRATGHFEEYEHGGEIVDQSKISRRFNQELRACGYISIKTGFWNNRPRVWYHP